MLDRRSLLVAAPATMFALSSVPARADDDEIATLEQKYGGRLGVAALDAGSGKSIAHRANERFAMCSTFKLLLVAATLHRVEAGGEHLAREIPYTRSDLLEHSPITSAHVAEGQMSVERLCEAAITRSDNCAANLLISALHGPDGVTVYAASLGDNVTHLDRMELALNHVSPGDERDTTTPKAMLGDLEKMFLGNVLSETSRARLTAWVRAAQDGLKRLRVGLPADWIVGDKAGTGPTSETNDIAIAWRPKRAPVLITAYYTGSTAGFDAREAVLADVGRIVARRFA
jgi:beta-lactamase class A